MHTLFTDITTLQIINNGLTRIIIRYGSVKFSIRNRGQQRSKPRIISFM